MTIARSAVLVVLFAAPALALAEPNVVQPVPLALPGGSVAVAADSHDAAPATRVPCDRRPW